MNKLTDEQITGIARELGDEEKHVFIFNKDGRWSIHEFARAIERALAAPPPIAGEPVASDTQRQAVKDAIAEALGDAYDCTRVWSAWSYGTMSADDFVQVAEQDDRLDEIAVAAITALRGVPHPAPIQSSPEAPAADAGQAGSEPVLSDERIDDLVRLHMRVNATHHWIAERPFARAIESEVRAALASTAGATVMGAGSERERLRAEQAAGVMPQIGPLLDAWDGLDNDTKAMLKEDAPDLARTLAAINRVMEGATPTPVPAAVMEDKKS